MGIYEELVERGLIAQVTNESEIRNMINNGKAVFYIGFDCTADSLTAGHFMALTLMKRLQMAGDFFILAASLQWKCGILTTGPPGKSSE